MMFWWFLSGFIVSTPALIGVWYIGENITVKNLLLYALFVCGGFFTVILSLFFIACILINETGYFYNSFLKGIFSKTIIKGYSGKNKDDTEYM